MITLPKLFNQYDPKWANDKHGTSSNTIGQTGCTITLLSAILCHAGYSETPATVDYKLTLNGGYSNGNLLNWTVVPKIWPKLKWVYRYYSYEDPKAKEWISRGLVPMIEVKANPIGGAPGGKHWVGALGDGETFDPWGGDIEKMKIWEPTGMALYEYTPITQGGTMKETDDAYGTLVSNSVKWDSTVKYLELPTDPNSTSFTDVQRVIAGLKSRVTDLQNQVNTSTAELQNRLEQVSRIKEQLLIDVETQKKLTINEKEARINAEKNLGVLQSQLESKQNQIDTIAKEKGELNIKLTAAENSAKEWEEKYKNLLTTHTAANVTLADALVILLKSFLGWAQNVVITKQTDIQIPKI